MRIAAEFQGYVEELTASHRRDDVLLLERSWIDACELYSRVLRVPVEGATSTEDLKPIVPWLQMAEVVAYDLAGSKYLLDEGFLVQSPAMLRPAMELGATLAILVWREV